MPKAKTKAKTIWVGIIPDIFGYGINVAAETRDEAFDALRREYVDWKKAILQPSSTNFDESFRYYGGYVIEVELGKGYHDGFGS